MNDTTFSSTPTLMLNLMTEVVSILPAYGDWCQKLHGQDSCVVALQTLSESDCTKALWFSSLIYNPVAALHRCTGRFLEAALGCYRILYAESLVDLSDQRFNASLPFCGRVDPISLAFDFANSAVVFIDNDTSIWTMQSNATDKPLELQPKPDIILPVDLEQISKSILHTSHPRLGISRKISNTSAFQPQTDTPLVNIRTNKYLLTKPVLIFPSMSGNFLSVFRAVYDGTRTDLLVTILEKINSKWIVRNTPSSYQLRLAGATNSTHLTKAKLSI